MNKQEGLGVTGLVVLLLKEGENEVSRKTVRNLVTNDGDLYYAERGVKTSIPTDFVDGSGDWDGVLVPGTGTTAVSKTHDYSDMTPIAGPVQLSVESGYPKVNDTDTDNSGSGADIITYKFVASTSSFNTDVTGALEEMCVTNPSPGAAENLLTRFLVSSVTKTASQTLTIFVNHTITGA